MRSMPSTNPSRVVEALASVSLIRTTLPLVRSTSVPTDERLAAPLSSRLPNGQGPAVPRFPPGGCGCSPCCRSCRAFRRPWSAAPGAACPAGSKSAAPSSTPRAAGRGSPGRSSHATPTARMMLRRRLPCASSYPRSAPATTASAADTPRLRRAVRPATVGSADRRAAHIRMENAPRGGRRNRLSPGEPLFEAVACLLRKRWSPEQIAGRRKRMEGGVEASSGLSVSHETIYQAIHALPRGELKKELLTCFRQDKPHRGRRSKVDEKRGKICNMASIHSRPGEIEGRLVPGHWEGYLIKGAANRSSVGTLVERTSGKVVLIKLTDAKASTTRDGFVEGMLRIPAPLRLTMTYDQGKEMARHRELAVATGIRVYFADPHSPWQRGSNENVNGLLRQYLPKGADLTKFAQAHLDGIAADLNSRPRKRHNYATPDEVFDRAIAFENLRIGLG